MTNQNLNPKLVKAHEALNVQPETPKSAYLLDADVQAAVDELHRVSGGAKPKVRIVNDLLRAALFTDALDGALAKEAA